MSTWWNHGLFAKAIATTALCLLAGTPANSTVFDATWASDNGVWSNGGLWAFDTPPQASTVFPNNTFIGAIEFFNVLIQSGNPNPSDVTLDVNVAIDSLALETGSHLTIAGLKTLTIVQDAGRPGSGAITNSSEIKIDGTAGTARLAIDGTATLGGGGAVALNSSPASDAEIISANGSGRLINTDNTILGAGRIGDSSLAIENSVSGVIDANVAFDQSGIIGNILTLDGRAGVTNSGTLRASGGGQLDLSDGRIDNDGGLIESTDADSVVNLLNNVEIRGGTLRGANGGVFSVTGDSKLDGNEFGPMTLESAQIGVVGSNLDLVGRLNLNTLGAGSATNLILDGANGGVQVNIDGTVTMGGDGTGVLTLKSDGSTGTGASIVAAGFGGDKLVNENNTIEGAGQVGDSNLAIDNRADGVIEANLAFDVAGNGQIGNVLKIGGGGVTNAGTLRARNGGELVLAGGEFVNSDGLVEATGTGSTVEISTSTAIRGGTLRATGGGVFNVASGATVTLDGGPDGQDASVGPMTLDGTPITAVGATLEMIGNFAFDAQASLTLDGRNNDARMNIEGTVRLDGDGQGGVVTLKSGGNTGSSAAIAGSGSNGALINVNNAIQGAGQVGDSNLAIDNRDGGLIEANVAFDAQGDISNVLRVGGGGVTNAGTLRARNGGELVLAGGEFVNSGGGTDGLIEATGAGSAVEISNNTTIRGGALRATGGGVFNVASGATVSLDGGPDGQDASVGPMILDGTQIGLIDATMTMTGDFTLNNAASFSLDGREFTTQINIEDTVTLNGQGVVTLKSGGGTGSSASIESGGGSSSLVNVNSTIEGAGNIAAAIDNRSVIDANVAFDPQGDTGNILRIGGGVTNTGTMRASNGGQLLLAGGPFNNAGGQIEAIAAGSGVEIGTSATVSGGTLRATAGGTVEIAGVATGLVSYTQDADSSMILNGGTLNTVGGAFFNDGVLKGTGLIEGGATFGADATIDIGFSPGILNFAGDSLFDGLIEFELAGTNPLIPEFDQLDVAGAATLNDGLTFNVTLLNAFLPGPADTFDIFTADSFVGEGGLAFDLAAIVLTGAPDFELGIFDFGAGRQALRLFITANQGTGGGGANSVPEPGTLMIFGSGLLLLVGVRRRRRAV